jgi:glycosyltransferase involved in cell wall biosynthesis
MVEEKGVQLLIQAVAGLDGPWTLRLIGDGPYLPRLEALSTKLGIADRVQFEPWKPAAEMPDHLSALDLLVLPSLTCRNWKEQFGRVLVEAMASEVPVVGSSSGEIPNVIGDAGLVFPESDVTALREALSELMTDPQLRAQLSQRGRARVLQHYTQQRIATETYGVYLRLLDGS